MKRYFIFCHGFGYDKDFWRHLTPYFNKETCIYLDSGYYGKKVEPDTFKCHTGSLVGIGHSLGFIKLLRLNKNFEYFIGLNSFINFLGNEQRLLQKRTCELQKFTHHLMASPITTIKKFHKRCGVSIENTKIANLNKKFIIKDLSLLSRLYNPQLKSTQTLILGTKDDIVVPPNLLHDNFSQYSNVTIKILDNGMHGLGFLEAATVYQKIQQFLTTHDQTKNSISI